MIVLFSLFLPIFRLNSPAITKQEELYHEQTPNHRPNSQLIRKSTFRIRSFMNKAADEYDGVDQSEYYLDHNGQQGPSHDSSSTYDKGRLKGFASADSLLNNTLVTYHSVLDEYSTRAPSDENFHIQKQNYLACTNSNTLAPSKFGSKLSYAPAPAQARTTKIPKPR